MPADWWPATRSSATLSACGTYRHSLVRDWAESGDEPRLCFVMLNPSTADHEVNDPTIKRCMGFARDHGFSGIEVVNLFDFRATKPADLARRGYPVSAQCDDHIEWAVRHASQVCVAWGAHASRPAVAARVQQVMPILFRQNKQPMCLHITASGHPQHPLMLPRTCELKPFTLEAIAAAMWAGKGSRGATCTVTRHP